MKPSEFFDIIYTNIGYSFYNHAQFIVLLFVSGGCTHEALSVHSLSYSEHYGYKIFNGNKPLSKYIKKSFPDTMPLDNIVKFFEEHSIDTALPNLMSKFGISIENMQIDKKAFFTALSKQFILFIKVVEWDSDFVKNTYYEQISLQTACADEHSPYTVDRPNIGETQKSNGSQMRLVHGVPAVLKTFTDREDKIREIGDQLQEFGWAMVSGMGGIGKTELVKQYIHKSNEKYNTVCFWDYKGSLLTTIASLPFQGYKGGDESEEDRYYAKLGILNEDCNKDTLIVIDNFDRTKNDSGDYVGAVSDEKFGDVRSGRYRIIFVSQTIHDDCLKLDALDLIHQKELFFKYYDIETTEDERRMIAGILDIIQGHTLMLILIAKTLLNSRGEISLPTLLEKLSTNKKTDISVNVNVEMDGRIHSAPMHKLIESIFDISQLSETEKYILMIMSLIPNDGINIKTFIDWVPGADLNDFNMLVNTGWIIIGENNTVASLHPVVSDVMANVLKPNSLNCERYLVSLNRYMSELNRGDDLTILNKAIDMCTGILKRIPYKTLPIGRILLNSGRIYRLIGVYKESLNYLKEALSIYENEEPGTIDQNELAEVYRQVGLSYSKLSQTKVAEEYYIRAKELFEGAVKPDYLLLARTLNLLGFYNKTQSSYPEALKYHNAALKMQQDHPSGDEAKDQLELASTYNYLGMYYNSQDDFVNSFKILSESYNIRQTLLPAGHRDIAESLNNIAWVYSKTGNWDKALKVYFENLEIKQAVLPENHPGIALAYYNIGGVYEKIGDTYDNYNKRNEYFEIALEYFKKALQIRIYLNIENAPQTATVYGGLCNICRKIGQFDDALVWIDKAIEIYRLTDKAELPSVANFYDIKGYVYRDMERYDDAMEYYKKAFNIRSGKIKESSLKMSNSYRNFADVYLGKKQYATAIEYYQKALTIRITKYPENHPKIQSIYKNLALAYQEIGDVDNTNEYRGKVTNMSNDSESDE